MVKEPNYLTKVTRPIDLLASIQVTRLVFFRVGKKISNCNPIFFIWMSLTTPPISRKRFRILLPVV